MEKLIFLSLSFFLPCKRIRVSDFPRAFSLEQTYDAKSLLCKFRTVKFICHVNELIIASLTRYFSPWYNFVSFEVNDKWHRNNSKNTTSRRNNVDDVINWIRWGRQITTDQSRQARKEVKKFKSFSKIEKLPSAFAAKRWMRMRDYQLTFMAIPSIERLRICFHNALNEHIAFNGCQHQLNNGFDCWLDCHEENVQINQSFKAHFLRLLP